MQGMIKLVEIYFLAVGREELIKIFLILIWVRIYTLEFIAWLKLSIIFFEKSYDKQENIRVCLLGSI